jgi:hypothetical protein
MRRIRIRRMGMMRRSYIKGIPKNGITPRQIQDCKMPLAFKRAFQYVSKAAFDHLEELP